MFEFFKDPFGTKRIAKLEAQLRTSLDGWERANINSSKFLRTIEAQKAEIADLQTQIARTPVAMGAYHILARNLDKLYGVDLEQAKGLFAAERPYKKPNPFRHKELPKLGEDQYL